jgi:hypothetical protein
MQTLGLGAVSVALLAVFLGRQARVANPLMPLRLFRSRNVTGANVVMALENAVQAGRVLQPKPCCGLGEGDARLLADECEEIVSPAPLALAI